MDRWIVFKDVVHGVLSPQQWRLRADNVKIMVLILNGINSTGDPFTLQGVILFNVQITNIDQWSFDFSL